MPGTALNDVIQRLSHPAPFVKRYLTDITQQCVKVLRENMYGTRLPQEWTSSVRVTQDRGEAIVWHTRLESDRETWEIIFHVMNHGSRRYMVYPVRAQALHWVDKDTGEDRFSKGHEVGGVQGKYFAEMTDAVIAEFERGLQSKWERWVNTGSY